VKLALKRARGGGRPPSLPGNLYGVYSYVEFHRKQKTMGGGALGISGACRKLKKGLDARFVNYQTTYKRLRTMYYEAREVFPAPILAEAREVTWNDGDFPLLLERKADGTDARVVDAWKKGGREPGRVCERRGNSCPRTKLAVVVPWKRS
jgi:hypothetical protein